MANKPVTPAEKRELQTQHKIFNLERALLKAEQRAFKFKQRVFLLEQKNAALREELRRRSKALECDFQELERVMKKKILGPSQE